MIELLIVVAIIGILAAIAMPNFLESQTRAKIARCVSDMRVVMMGMKQYEVDQNQFPCAPGAFYMGNEDPPNWWSDYVLIEGDTVIHCGTLLTSPVSYLSSIPYDEFNSYMAQNMNSGDSSQQNYYARDSRWSFMFSGVPYGGSTAMLESWKTTWPQPTAAWDFNFRYFLESCGPNAGWDSCLAYDPTNGTISRGQIIYFDTGNSFPLK